MRLPVGNAYFGFGKLEMFEWGVGFDARIDGRHSSYVGFSFIKWWVGVA